MAKMSSFFIEAFVVGLAMAAIFYILQMVDFIKEKTNIFMQVFLAGIIGHIIFEVIGANKWYCDNGMACKSS